MKLSRLFLCLLFYCTPYAFAAEAVEAPPVEEAVAEVPPVEEAAAETVEEKVEEVVTESDESS